ncbi:MAG TPA: hypothetical protein VHK69_11280, partial [Chitinophagaceae bacterium]|nr:hypothetical protein [Chitinophagaceae bacterium]
ALPYYMKNWLISIGLVVSLAFGSCGKVKDPEFRRLDNFGVKNLGLQKATIGVEVVYFNPNNFGVTVKEAVADLYIDSVHMGTFRQPAGIEVQKNAEFGIPLSGEISLQKALQLNLTDLQNREVQVRANGSVRVGKAGVFVTRPVQYQGRHKLDIKL